MPSTPQSSSADRPREVLRAAAIGAAVGSVAFVWMLTRGTFALFRAQPMGDFFDAQAHAFLRGELFVDPGLLKVEAFPGTGGHSYMYFGPWPAILRLPVAWCTHRFDGRLSGVSMLLAYTVSMTSLAGVARDVARRTGAAPSARALWLIGTLFAVLGGGSSLVYLASTSWVFHEATSWGIAWSLVTFTAVRRAIEKDTRGAIAAVSAATILTVLSRISIGLGTVAAVGLASLFSEVPRSLGRRASLFVSGALAPLGVYMTLNHAKFGTLTTIPSLAQSGTVIDPERTAMLAQNHGSLFGLKFMPTTLLAYLRPDGLRFQRCFPFVDFPLVPGKIIGNVLLDKFDLAASVTTTQPLLWVLGLFGLVAVFRRGSLRPYRVVLAGAATSWATVIPFAHIAHRYTADAFPFLSLAAVVGIVSSSMNGWARPRLAFFAALAFATAWTNLGLSLLYQRLYVPVRDPGDFVNFLERQLSVDQAFRRGSPWPVTTGDMMSVRGKRAEFFIVGDCDALYYSDGHKPSTLEHRGWVATERTEAAGFFELSAVVTDAPPGAIEPLLSVPESDGPDDVVGLEHLGEGRARIVYRGRGLPGASAEFEAPAGAKLAVTIDADRRLGVLTVTVQGLTSFLTWYGAGVDDYRLGTGQAPGVAPSFAGVVTRRETPSAPLCRRLRELERS